MPDPTNATSINVWEDDPGAGPAPEGGVLVNRPIPDLSAQPFPMKIVTTGPAPAPDQYSPGTPGFRYWVAAEALRRMADFSGLIVPGGAWNPTVGAVLPVRRDEGVDLNAFYDRRALHFFHAEVGGKTVFSGESADILAHEAGHALLDSSTLKPQLWSAAAIEVGAFHESYADAIAISTALQLPSLRSAVLADTGGQLFRSSRLSRLAEQLGWAIRQFDASAVDPDCLRNAANSLFYRSPDELPTTAPASELSSEPHSLSRVFTAAFLQGLAGMLASRPTQTEADLQEVSVDMGKLLVTAIRKSHVVPEYFSQVGAHLLSAAATMNKGYAEAIQRAMVRHGILSVAGAAGVAKAPQPLGFAAFSALPLPRQDLDVSGYGFTVATIKVEAASQPKTFGIAGASTSFGDASSASADHAARTFLEDLMRRGRLDPGKFATPGVTVVDPTTLKTHELVEDGNDVILTRQRFDCIPRRRT
jgi:hypothetical protein